ncbi:hypothetical protein BJY01DRAFT_210368 [Aspergillus pseudoustus]|uniref:Uncharacterized protein n=1 Tax=Aspergillus pseudoustus TaxID=1810923 RepID=A0ABR4KC22_9EURO
MCSSAPRRLSLERVEKSCSPNSITYTPKFVVYDDPHGFPTVLVQIIVKNEDDAWRTFRLPFRDLFRRC